MKTKTVIRILEATEHLITKLIPQSGQEYMLKPHNTPDSVSQKFQELENKLKKDKDSLSKINKDKDIDWIIYTMRPIINIANDALKKIIMPQQGTQSIDKTITQFIRAFNPNNNTGVNTIPKIKLIAQVESIWNHIKDNIK